MVQSAYNMQTSIHKNIEQGFFLTLNWKHRRQNGSIRVKEALFFAARKSKFHVPFNIFEGVQMKKLMETGISHPDIHVLLQLVPPQSEMAVNDFKKAFSRKLRRTSGWGNLDWRRFDEHRNWLPYLFKHEWLTTGVACPRARKCRKHSSCVFSGSEPMRRTIQKVNIQQRRCA